MRPSPSGFQKVARSMSDCCASLRTLLLRTDVRRWRRTATEAPPWDGRNQMIAGLIPGGSSVLDLGSGAQTLRQYLKPGCRYQPCDVVKSSADVLLCDFNRGLYPQVEEPFDYAVCSGVFEYVRAPERFLTRVVALGNQAILSYATAQADEGRWDRWRHGWVNHYTRSQLEGLFAALGLRSQPTARWGRHLIYTIGRAG
jgi:Methionine biosynthesis protein MetW